MVCEAIMIVLIFKPQDHSTDIPVFKTPAQEPGLSQKDIHIDISLQGGGKGVNGDPTINDPASTIAPGLKGMRRSWPLTVPSPLGAARLPPE